MQDNFIQPFQLETSLIRGRVVRMGSVLNDILAAHKYPEDVLHLTGEMTVLCAMLSSMLKYDGIFTLQAKGDGAVKMLVADMTSGGDIRACASFKDEEMVFVENRAELLGTGYLAFTVDQGEFAERYQGIVELKSQSLITSVQHYFNQSEQIMTGMVMHVGKVDGQWRGCGIMVQQMPEDAAGYNKDQSGLDEDDWRRTMILMGSVTEDEMLTPDLSANDLLFRLFHEEGVRIFEPTTLVKNCRCSPDRVGRILSTMSADDIDHITVDGKVVMTCEFCSRDYIIDPNDYKPLEKN